MSLASKVGRGIFTLLGVVEFLFDGIGRVRKLARAVGKTKPLSREEERQKRLNSKGPQSPRSWPPVGRGP